MNEPLLERIRQLERANRRWKRATLGLGLAVALLLALWAGFGVRLLWEFFPGLAERARQAEMEAMMQRDRAEVELQRAQQALRAVEIERQRAQEAERRARQEAEEATP